jgi:predicted SnoaL-like aldol condensation-catalyzing enzyme
LTEFQKFAEKGENPMASAENKAVVSSFVEEVINQGRLERVNDLVALDFVELDPLPGQQQGREGLKQVIAAFRTAFPDIHWAIEEMMGEGDKVFSRFS